MQNTHHFGNVFVATNSNRVSIVSFIRDRREQQLFATGNKALLPPADTAR
jgi:hypothetical protein